jgi:D-alanine transaminase
MAEPLPVCYLNGEYQPLRDARVSPLDRGFLFADSVYEVLPVHSGRMYRFREHFDRLQRSLHEVQIASPHTHAQWEALLEELIARNGARDMYIYVQVTRGMEFGRNHAFPVPAVSPTVFALCSPLPVLTDVVRENGIAAITVEDFRWGRCDIKATTLLANVLMKQQAAAAGAQEAIIIRDGEVLEGSSTSIFVVYKDVLLTPPNSHRILPGTTRDAALELATSLMPVSVRNITVDELRDGNEVWIAAATRDVIPVTQVDGVSIGDGKPGLRWRQMQRSFIASRQLLADVPAYE